MKKAWFYVTILLLVVLLGWFTWWVNQLPPPGTPSSPEPTANAPSASPGAGSGDSAVIHTTRLAAREDGVNRWELEAEVITVDDVKHVADARNLTCTFFNPDRKPILVVKASGADINLQTNDVDFRGQVRARATSGETIQVAKLRWDGQKKKIIGTGSVRLTRKDAVLVGREMIADPALSQVEFRGDVRFTLRRSEDFFKETLF